MTMTTLRIVTLLVLLSAAYPLWRMKRSLSNTSLNHSASWLFVAWAAWVAAEGLPLVAAPARPLRYFALALTACYVVAVLGARRPGLATWNIVVVGLLVTLLLPVLQQPWSDGSWQLESPWEFFVGAILALGCLNYLPTSAAMLAGVASVGFCVHLFSLTAPPYLEEIPKAAAWLHHLQWFGIFAVWGVFFLRRASAAEHTPDGVWRRFRDYYGLVWAKRVQEQFNAAAKNAGWHVRLDWINGLQAEPGHLPPSAEQEAVMLQTLQATMKRFGIVVSEPTA